MKDRELLKTVLSPNYIKVDILDMAKTCSNITVKTTFEPHNKNYSIICEIKYDSEKKLWNVCCWKNVYGLNSCMIQMDRTYFQLFDNAKNQLENNAIQNSLMLLGMIDNVYEKTN